MPDTLQKATIREGNGIDKPQAGNIVTMDYTGWLCNTDHPFSFDSSKDRGEFNTQIGVKKVIQRYVCHVHEFRQRDAD